MLTIEGIDKILEFIPATQKEIQRAGRNAVNATSTYLKKRAIERISTETGLNKKTVKGRSVIKGINTSKHGIASSRIN